MYNRPLFTHPEELVVIIVSQVEKRRDLLSLALTSKLFQRIIIPSFLDVVHIRCDPRRTDVWQWLSANPRLAMRTRTLELVNEDYYQLGSRPPIVPSFAQFFDRVSEREVYKECILSLAAAMMHMTHLCRFRWCVDLPVPHAIESLLITLGRRNDMDEFYFVFSDGLSYYAEGSALEGSSPRGHFNLQSISPLGNFINITTFSIIVESLLLHQDGPGSLIQDWIIQFTKLKHLKVAFSDTYFDFPDMLRRAHWPSLVELSLEANYGLFPEILNDISTERNDSDNASDENDFATFLHHHPNIERLEIRTDDDYSSFIQPQTVTRLKSLILRDCQFVDSLLAKSLGDWFPLDIAQQIQYLECPISAKSLSILPAMTSLRVLNVVRMDLKIFQHVVEVVPGIQQLSIPYGYWYNRCTAPFEVHHLADTITSSLLKLKNLVRVYGRFTYNTRDLSGIQYIITRLLEHEHLLYIDSFTREKWDLFIKLAPLGGKFRFPLPSVNCSDIRQSGGFYTKSWD